MTLESANFWLFSTAGNTTLFVDRREAVLKAMRVLPCEQAGVVGRDFIEMAGGEFCANACLAYAALCKIKSRDGYTVDMSGVKMHLSASGQTPIWDCIARFSRPPWKIVNRHKVAVLSGIAHAFVEGPPPRGEGIYPQAANIRQKLNLDMLPAAGVVWWQRNEDEIELTPLVNVPTAETCNLESACGSASLGLAMLLGEGTWKFRQPSCHILTVTNEDGEFSLGGQVTLMASGSVWA